MALYNCEDCDAKVSTQAVACPQCGKPNTFEAQQQLEVRFENNMIELNRTVDDARALCIKAIDKLGLKYGANAEAILVYGATWKHNGAQLGLIFGMKTPSRTTVSYSDETPHFGPGITKLTREFENALKEVADLRGL